MSVKANIELLRNFATAEAEKLNAKPSVGVMIGDADPDSIGAGIGMKMLLSLLGFGNIDLIHDGEISLEQNKTVLNVLSLDVSSRNDVSKNAEKSFSEKYNFFTFVDCSPRTKTDKKLDAIFILDHHPWDETKTNLAALPDIRLNVGSSCAMVWEYLKEAGYQFDAGDEKSSNVATGLFFGIQNDTQSFTTENTSALDIEAYADLARFINRQKLSRIIDYEMSSASFEIRRHMEKEENILQKG